MLHMLLCFSTYVNRKGYFQMGAKRMETSKQMYRVRRRCNKIDEVIDAHMNMINAFHFTGISKSQSAPSGSIFSYPTTKLVAVTNVSIPSCRSMAASYSTEPS